MDFLRVNVRFYNVVKMIHDVIKTANPFPYTAKNHVCRGRNNKTRQIRF